MNLLVFLIRKKMMETKNIFLNKNLVFFSFNWRFKPNYLIRFFKKINIHNHAKYLKMSTRKKQNY